MLDRHGRPVTGRRTMFPWDSADVARSSDGLGFAKWRLEYNEARWQKQRETTSACTIATAADVRRIIVSRYPDADEILLCAASL